MRKIDSLRETLTATIEELRTTLAAARLGRPGHRAKPPERHVRLCHGLPPQCAADDDHRLAVGYIVCAWLRTHQPAAGPGQDAFALDIDMIDNGTYDALLQIDLTQSVASRAMTRATPRSPTCPNPSPCFSTNSPSPPCPRSPCLNPSP
jgi:hypothetical protein